VKNDQWLDLGDKLAALQHRQWLSQLPADYRPLLTSSTVTRLELSAQAHRELAFEIASVKRQILAEARLHHLAVFGSVPGWLIEALQETVKI
jgi:hypothetical protein